MPPCFLVQMAGVPGAGKSTVAREIGRRLRAVVIDNDVFKSALVDQGISFDQAGRIAYPTSWALARSILEQGFSVVMDSPCYYQEILDAGQELAAAVAACYRYIECVTEDLDEISRRLRSRVPRPTQRRDLDVAPAAQGGGREELSGPDLFVEWRLNTKRPAHSYLRIDTSRPLAQCLAEVFAFLDECAPAL